MTRNSLHMHDPLSLLRANDLIVSVLWWLWWLWKEWAMSVLWFCRLVRISSRCSTILARCNLIHSLDRIWLHYTEFFFWTRSEIIQVRVMFARESGIWNLVWLPGGNLLQERKEHSSWNSSLVVTQNILPSWAVSRYKLEKALSISAQSNYFHEWRCHMPRSGCE